MRRRLAAGVVAILAGVMGWTAVAGAVASDVRMGNFYFEDASVGDGQIVITAGDQLRFIVEDSGPGTPHTVDIDEFGVHSGNLAKGETYTTAALTTPGTYALYCDLHRNRGHETTLIILPGAATTTTAPPTTTTITASTTTTTTTMSTAPPTTTTASASATTVSASDTPATTTTAASSATVQAADEADGPGPEDDGESAAAVDADDGPTAPGAKAAPVPEGRGQIDLDDVDPLPPAAGSLEAILGRPPADNGPWTRAVWSSLLALVPLALIAVMSLIRFNRAQPTSTES
jgi:plastocyanin